MIPVMRPKLPQADDVLPYLRRMDDSRIYSNRGPLVSQLEDRIADKFKINPQQVVLTANATLAIQGAISISNIEKVRIPAFTFPATLHAALAATPKKTLFLEDIDPETWMLKQNKNVSDFLDIFVIPFGKNLDIKNFDLEKHLVIDAAASIGTKDLDLSAIGKNWVIIFSLHATKAFGIGEGGIAIFGSSENSECFRSWINFGFRGVRLSQISATNAKMSEISACYGLAIFDRWQTEWDEWEKINKYSCEISQKLNIDTGFDWRKGISPYWIVNFRSEELVKVAESVFLSNQIETRRWWGGGIHKMPAFKSLSSGEYKSTEKIASETLGLPCFRDLSNENIETIGQILEDILKAK